MNQIFKADPEMASEIPDLRRIVAVGPAFQLITDAVQSVVNGGIGYDEIFFPKISVKTVDHMVPGPPGLDAVAEKIPAVEFEGRILEIGGRPVSTVEAQFKQELRTKLNSIGGMEYQDVGALDTTTGAFKFRVRQIRTPEQVEQDRKAAASDNTAPEKP